MKTEAEFERFFQTTLLGDLNELEISRQKIVRKLRILLFFELVILIGLGMYLFWYHPYMTGTKVEFDGVTIFWIMLGLIISVILFLVIITNISKKFISGFKEQIIRRIINQIGKEIQYLPNGKIELNEFKDSGIYKMYNDKIGKFDGRDLVTSRIGEISYRFSWLESEYKQDSISHISTSRSNISSHKTTYHRFFRGIFFVADFGTPFPVNIIIWPKFINKIDLGGIVNSMLEKSLGNRIHLEDTTFEQEFTVFGEDESLAKRILTPGLKQWILDFKSKTGSRLQLSLTGTKMNLAIPMKKNLFQPSIFKKVTDYNLIFENFQYLLLFNGLLEDLSKKH